MCPGRISDGRRTDLAVEGAGLVADEAVLGQERRRAVAVAEVHGSALCVIVLVFSVINVPLGCREHHSFLTMN